MKKLNVYLDTSVIGGCFDTEFIEDSNRVIQSIEIGVYRGVISDITINELLHAPQNVKELISNIKENLLILELNDEVINLSNEYLNNKVVTDKYKEDALHIAFATIFEADVLLSWNFKHIVNLNKIKQFNSINLSQGYKILEIRSPKELFYEEQ